MSMALMPAAYDVAAPLAAHAQNEDASQIRDLAERLLATPTSSLTGVASVAHLFVGQLPPSMPFDLPVPPGGRIIGSHERSGGGETTGIDIAIEAPGNPST